MGIFLLIFQYVGSLCGASLWVFTILANVVQRFYIHMFVAVAIHSIYNNVIML